MAEMAALISPVKPLTADARQGEPPFPFRVVHVPLQGILSLCLVESSPRGRRLFNGSSERRLIRGTLATLPSLRFLPFLAWSESIQKDPTKIVFEFQTSLPTSISFYNNSRKISTLVFYNSHVSRVTRCILINHQNLKFEFPDFQLTKNYCQTNYLILTKFQYVQLRDTYVHRTCINHFLENLNSSFLIFS